MAAMPEGNASVGAPSSAARDSSSTVHVGESQRPYW